MKPRPIWFALAAALLTGIPAASADVFNTSITTSNWAGYAATAPAGSAFTSVSATWTVPSLTTTLPDDTTYSTFWTGFDGITNSTVEQVGINARDVSDFPEYYAWYELYPGAEQPISSLILSPGDVISARVDYLGFREYAFVISDLTTGRQFNTTIATSVDANRSSAEWIAEAPSVGGPTTLANFGSLTFNSASATLDSSQPGSISYFSNLSINMKQNGLLVATPGPLDATGSSFTLTWVPEPASLALLLAATPLLLARRARRL